MKKRIRHTLREIRELTSEIEHKNRVISLAELRISGLNKEIEVLNSAYRFFKKNLDVEFEESSFLFRVIVYLSIGMLVLSLGVAYIQNAYGA